MAKRPINFDAFDEVQLIGPSDDVDYAAYDIENGPRYVYDPQNQLDVTSNRNYTEFVKALQSRGGIREHLHSTVAQIATLRLGNSSTNGELGIAGDDRVFKTRASKLMRYAHRWHKHVQFPAKMETIQAHYGNSTPYDWVLQRFSEGYAYNDLAHALGVEVVTLTSWLWLIAPHEQIASAQKARTQYMLDQADHLLNEAMSADFSSVSEGLQAEQRAKVLASVGSHLRMQAVAHHPAYQPKKSEVTVTPGSISISFAAPD